MKKLLTIDPYTQFYLRINGLYARPYVFSVCTKLSLVRLVLHTVY